MRTITEDFDYSPERYYPPERIGTPTDLLFFDIETTGFSAKTAAIYLIGCVYLEEDVWKLRQWFADTPEDEAEIIRAFFLFRKNFRTLVHFNGHMFDIPFVSGRCEKLGLTPDFDGMDSFDIYRKIRPLRDLLGMDSLKQKSVEQFLGIDREDRYTGGQLIEVYREYVRTQSPARLHLLLQHNADDLRGMPEILPILAYPDLITGGSFVLEDLSFPSALMESAPEKTSADPEFSDPASSRAISDNTQPPYYAVLRFRSSVSVPVPFTLTAGGIELQMENDLATVRLTPYCGELKHFYPDYQNYYYLPAEDCAYHKSVAEFVEKSARKKATAKTCYTRTTGTFLPVPSGIFPMTFRGDCASPVEYVEAKEEIFRSADLSGLVPALFGSYRKKLL